MRRLIVVTGAPGTGKTTVARALAERLGLALVSKDTIKEALADVLGAPDVEASRRLSAATYEVLFALATGLRASIIDANLPERAAERLRALQPIELFCRCDPDLALRRYRERARHPVHHDVEMLDEIAARLRRGQQPLGFGGPLLAIDTDDDVDIEHIARWVRAQSD